MNFKQEYYILYVVISLSVSFIISFLYYRKTALSRIAKYFLISLRTLTLSLIFLLLLISYITLSNKVKEKPLNIFLFDNSISMSLENRIDGLKNVQDIINSLSNGNSENRYFTFSGDNLKEIEKKDIQNIVVDSASSSGTNLSNTLFKISEKFADKKISSVNIFSDGLINNGGNPLNIAQQTGAIFNYFLIGDTIQKNDLLIKNVFFNNTVYTESNTQILVEINSYNYNKTVKVNLYEDDNLIQSKDLAVNKENTDYNQKFTVKSDAEGIKKYRVEISNEPDEITNKNNSEEFFIEFINNKFKMLVLSGNPSSDFSYLIGTIKSINNIEARFFTQKSPGVFYEGQPSPLDEFNILLLINFPNTATDLSFINKIAEDLKKLKIPLIFISGSNTDYEKLKLLTDYLPINAISQGGTEVNSGVKAINDLSSDLEGYFSFGNSISNLPEIYIPGVNFTLKSDSKTILYSSKASKPVLVISQNGERNSAAFFGYDFYKWRLNSSGSDTKNILGRIISGIMMNISNKENDKKININLERQTFAPDELININASLNLLDIKGNESVKIQIYNNNDNREIPVNKISNSNFSGSANISDKGEYFVKATLYREGTEIGQDIKKILIKENVVEYKRTKPERSLLDNLANSTGGERIDTKNQETLKDKIRQRNENDISIQLSTNKIYLNSSLILLIIIILLFSIEWLIRKRQNLP